MVEAEGGKQEKEEEKKVKNVAKTIDDLFNDINF
jgi:hypothetical protein